MPSDLQPLGERPNRGGLGGGGQWFGVGGSITQWKLEMGETELKGPLATKAIRKRNRVFCYSCEISTGRRKGKCVKCDEGVGMFSRCLTNAGEGFEGSLVTCRERKKWGMDINDQSMVILLSYALSCTQL